MPEHLARMLALCALWIGAGLARATGGQAVPSSTVGVPGRIEELVLPAPELEVVPLERESPLVLRIVAARPHGSAFRYDLEYCGLEPGEYDLGKLLRPIPSSADVASALPPIPVSIHSLLAAGQVLPHQPEDGWLPRLGGYRTFLILLGLLWACGLWAILRVGRSKAPAQTDGTARPKSLAERLQPLVERAVAGELSRSERAQLELALVAFWRKRLGLEAGSPAQASVALREHAEAGPLLRSLDEWLHMPSPPRAVDLARLLTPYRNLPADALELEPAPASAS